MCRLRAFIALVSIALAFTAAFAGCARSRHLRREARRAAEPPAFSVAEAVSPTGRAYVGPPPGADVAKLEAELAAARADLLHHPNDPERIVWVGRRLGYLWRMNEAIEVYTDGIRRFPNYAPLYRHRGHRFISVRKFDDAISDLQRAVELMRFKLDEVEQDGQPNQQNIPLTTLRFNLWYHVGVAKYLTGDYAGAEEAFVETTNHTRGLDDNRVAVMDWLYLTLKRQGKDKEAVKLLKPLREGMNIIENHAYYQRVLMYKGIRSVDEVRQSLAGAKGTDAATLGYGLAQWYLHNGRKAEADEMLANVAASGQWPAFAYIAAEVDSARR